MSTFLHQLASAYRKGAPAGIYSVCSAHPWVLEAAMRSARKGEGPLLIEATCNQVNQFGGYTGMKPGDFRQHVLAIAQKIGFPAEQILLGGDHLGPHPWRHLPAAEAMRNAVEMVQLYVKEGFTKIHLDASMACAGDPHVLPDETIAARAVELCRAAESSRKMALSYVIGTEVPTPGGSVESEEKVSVTTTDAAEQAISAHRKAFAAAGLDEAWNDVIALVVQPGVEFADNHVVDYNLAKARHLAGVLKQHPQFIFEAHSTDYQRPLAYRELVRDGFSILKVGPALTYAMRQALFALARMEMECIPYDEQSNLMQVVEDAMLKRPGDWKSHYHGEPNHQRLLRKYSYSDRIRYYWLVPEVKTAVDRLILNMSRQSLDEILLSEFLPAQYEKVRGGAIKPETMPVLLDKIEDALAPYQAACAKQ
ncbi:MAG TPA: D-tagatose-bisphosphate aldolase, class II, non-catalytic subunit [Edaphobacter sp.]|nr:D-tagatose-bisphosphate aldolase, class II, non-catalytic subunit [Edaphobacter sp.]